MRKLALLVLISLLAVFVACDDTSDSPKLSESEALDINNKIFVAMNKLMEEGQSSGSDNLTRSAQTATINIETATYKITGDMTYDTSTYEYTIKMKVEITSDYTVSDLTLTEAVIEYDYKLKSGKMNGKITGNYRFTYKDNPYKCSWTFEIEDNKFSGEYDMNGDKYTFDYTSRAE